MSITNRTFISASHIGSYRRIADAIRYYGVSKKEAALTGDSFIPDNFVGLNYHVIDPISSSENTLGFPAAINWTNVNNTAYNKSFMSNFYSVVVLSKPMTPTYLNTLLNKRGSVYGWSTWKQIRNSEHPIVRYQIKNNQLLFLEPSEIKRPTGGTFLTIQALKGEKHTVYTEPFISFKYSPLIHSIRDPYSDDSFVVKHTFGNNINGFSNSELNDKLKFKSCENSTQLYNSLLDSILGKNESALDGHFEYLRYEESIFPTGINVFSSNSRNRTNYYVYGWKDSRNSRHISTVTNSQGYVVDRQSLWALDGRNNYETATLVTGGMGGEGELQNNYVTFFDTGSIDPFFMGNINPSVVSFNLQRLNLSDFFYLRDGINASASWNNLIGGTNETNTKKFTVSVWLNATSSLDNQTNKQTIIEFGSPAVSGIRSFYLTTGSNWSGTKSTTRRIAFSASYSAGAGTTNEWCTYTTSDGGTELAQNTWYHVGMSFDPLQAIAINRVNIFVNGVSQPVYAPNLTSTGLDSITYIPGTQLAIASIGSGALNNKAIPAVVVAAPFMGHMSDLAIFSGTFSAGEMGEIYHGGVPQSLYYHSRKNDLISWWRLGGGQGLNFGISSDFSLVGFETAGGAYVINDVISGSYTDPAGAGFIIQNMNLGRNKINDMAGSNNGIPQHTMSSSALVTNHTLQGVSEKVRIKNWADNFKVGAIFSRHVPEYTGIPWITTTISSSQGLRYIRVTGSLVYAGDTKWTADDESGLTPYHETYNKYSEDLRQAGKEYSIIPEFRISEHMDYYLDQKGANFLEDNEGFLTLTGSVFTLNSKDSGFYKTFSHSEFLNNFEVLQKDHKKIANVSNLSLKCSALLKFLPYKGFYPLERTLQLAELFSKSYGDYVRPAGYVYNPKATVFPETTASWRAFLTPFFGPGILYNSIKAGMACDYPIYADDNYPETMEDYKSGVGFYDFVSGAYENYSQISASQGRLFFTTRGIYGYPFSASINQWTSHYNGTAWDLFSSSYYNQEAPMSLDSSASWTTVLKTEFSKRIPFDGLVSPENYIAKSKIWDMEPNYSASLRKILVDSSTNQAVFWGGQGKLQYKLAMHNFLAAVPEFFLKGGKFTSFYSRPVSNNSGITIKKEDENSFFGMDVIIGNGQCRSFTDWNIRKGLPQFSSLVSDFHNITEQELNQVKGTHTQVYSRNSAFGPPWVYPHHIFTASSNVFSYHYSYEPFTPAYMNGFATARLLFYPFKRAGIYTLEEIQSNITASYITFPNDRLNVAGVSLINNYLDYVTRLSIDQNLYEPVDGDGNVTIHSSSMAILSASANFQRLSSSVDLFGLAKAKEVTYLKGVVEDFEVSSVTDNVQDVKNIWVIQPRWETPIFNFYNKSLIQPFNLQGSGSLAKGMWHQFGNFCQGIEGIWFSINDLPNINLNTSLFFNESENTVNLKKDNAYVDLYIRDYTKLAGFSRIITLDNTNLREGAGFQWLATDSNLKTAASITNAINRSTDISYALPSGSQLRHRFEASYSLAEKHPWVNNLGSTGTPTAVVRISVRDVATTSSFAGSVFDNKSVGVDYPNYYASGKLGNKLTINLADASQALSDTWISDGGDKDNNRLLDVVTFFKGGNTPKYKVKSLADLLGFEKTSKRLGETAEEKMIKEAVVAVPFIEKNRNKSFFGISRRVIDIALGKKKLAENEKPVGKSIVNMILRMKEYVFPPKFDFVTNETVSPFAMYIFEFEYKLTREDLRRIWQNLPPQVARTVIKKEVTLEHELLENELLDGNNLNNLRWMLFKVKQKMPNNYFAKTADSRDDDRFKFDQFKDTGGIPSYSYNYPADFFSLVELVKMSATVDFVKKS